MRFSLSDYRHRCLVYATLGLVWTFLGALWHLYGYSLASSYPGGQYPWWVNLGNLLAVGALIALVSIPGGRTPASGTWITVPIGVLVNFVIVAMIGEVVWSFRNRRRG